MRSRNTVAAVAMLGLLLTIVCASQLLGQESATSAPTTEPTTATLAGGIVFTPPAGWSPAGHGGNGRILAYESPDKSGVMAVNVDAQEVSLANNDQAAMKIGQMVSKQIRDNAAKSGGKIEIVDQPKVEKDPRFFLRIHHRFKKGDKIGDELQIYRAIGLNLVTVAVTAWKDSPDDAKPIHELAEQVLLSAHLRGAAPASPPGHPLAGRAGASNDSLPKPTTRPAAPIALPHAKLLIAIPNSLGNWKIETNDAESGIVVTLRDPQATTPFVLITVSVSPLPKEARSEPKLRDLAIEQMLSSERQQLQITGSKGEPKTDVIKDNRFLRKTRAKYETTGDEVQLISRQLRIGDSLVSVSAVATSDQAAAIDKLADDLAVKIRPSGR